MKKLLIGILALALVAGAALATFSYVSAQAGTPPSSTPGSGYGRGGMMNGSAAGSMGRGGMMGARAGSDDLDGPMHDEMIAALAGKLGLSVDDLNARLAKGETMAQIATAKGLTTAQFSELMTQVRAAALDQAVKDGSLTQAQADWMKQRGAGQMGAGQMGARGGRGFGGTQNCPMAPQTNP
jgi:hypothetical protein